MRRVIREYGGCRLRHDIGELVSFDLVPDIEDETAARFKDVPCFGITGDSVRKKHDAELTNDGIERGLVEW